MPTVHDTAYPRLKNSISRRELTDLYTPTQAELELAARAAKSETAKLSFLVLLKTFQRLGYFIILGEVPRCIVEHIGHDRGMLIVPETTAEYDQSGTRRRHVTMIRNYLHVRALTRQGRRCLLPVSALQRRGWKISPTLLTSPSKN